MDKVTRDRAGELKRHLELRLTGPKHPEPDGRVPDIGPYHTTIPLKLVLELIDFITKIEAA